MPTIPMKPGTLRLTTAAAVCVWMAALVTPATAQELVVSGPDRVADVALLSGEFGQWNFGAGPVLEAGLMGGIYAEHHAVSLLHFDLSGMSLPPIASAVMRLYKPKSFTQTRHVEVRVFEVCPANARWKEGRGVCEEVAEGSSWKWVRAGNTWAGEEGCGTAGIDFVESMLARQTAPADRGLWLEFPIPTAVVTRWAADPSSNAGLLVRLKAPAEEWGEHVYFHSSEHYLGRTPQLRISTGEVAPEAPPGNAVAREDVEGLPPGGPAFERWLQSNERLARFARAGRMDRRQAQVFFYFDTTARGQLHVVRYEGPMNELLERMETHIREGDTPALRASLNEVRRLLLVWEYIRETSWYTAGTLADTLSPLQLGILFGTSIFGRMEEAAREKGKTIWVPLSGDALEANVDRSLARVRRDLELAPEHADNIESIIAECERREHEHLATFRAALTRVQALVAQEDDGPEMFRCVRDLHMSHERFLYYQSIYNTPRWSAFMKGASPDSFARWVVKGRKDYYQRRAPMLLEHVRQYGVSLEPSVEPEHK